MKVEFTFFHKSAPPEMSRIFVVWSRDSVNMCHFVGEWDGGFHYDEAMSNGHIIKIHCDKTWLNDVDAAWCLESHLRDACHFFPF